MTKIKPFININEVPLEIFEKGSFYKDQSGGISEFIGAKLLSYSITIVAPGKISCPFHAHYVNEEMFLILEGNGTLRFGADTFEIKAGDVIACPPGSKDVAHQIINTSDAPLKYFSLSTTHETDICEYPDSGKFGAFGPTTEINGEKSRQLRFLGRAGDSLDYWDGEKID